VVLGKISQKMRVQGKERSIALQLLNVAKLLLEGQNEDDRSQKHQDARRSKRTNQKRKTHVERNRQLRGGKEGVGSHRGQSRTGEGYKRSELQEGEGGLTRIVLETKKRTVTARAGLRETVI